MSPKPEDGIVWITGASSGLGRAFAIDLARRGFRVMAGPISGLVARRFGV
jgi:short-subunit dehydrogenase